MECHCSRIVLIYNGSIKWLRIDRSMLLCDFEKEIDVYRSINVV